MRRITDRPMVELSGQDCQKMQALFMQLEDEVHEVYMADAAEESEEERALRNLSITNKVIGIILVLMRDKNAPKKKKSGVDASEIFLYLYSHLNERVTLEQLSQKFYMSESAIGAYIKKTTGLSFFDLMNEMRIGRTMNYLLYTDFTLEELADKLGFEGSAKEAFLAQCDRYNAIYDKGEDDEFFKSSHYLSQLRKAPFYGVWLGASLLCTGDGLKINNKMQVLDKEKQVIPGLYAIGNASGSFFANNYPELFPGLACGRTLTFAIKAVKVIAGEE